MNTVIKAKKQLDTIIRKARVHLYKPFQVAEILKEHRELKNFNLRDLESYRNASKRWRDRVSLRLVGRVCTSSARFQDNLFEANAMPSELIAILGDENERDDRIAIVEAYIYRAFQIRVAPLKLLANHIVEASPHTFNISEFIDGFRREPGLKRSVDKAYEITVYALFSTIVRHLRATVSVSIPKSKLSVLKEFEDFTRIVLGITAENPEMKIPAKLYRVGVTNAADRGLDMWANFGPAVQIKHISLTEDIAEEVVNQVTADKIVIVCRDAERGVIERILTQIGISDRLQGIITQADLENWYSLCFSEKHSDSLGNSLLEDFRREFLFEFPATGNVLDEFIIERDYDKVEMVDIWAD